MKPTYEGFVAMHINNAGVLALRPASESDIKDGNVYSHEDADQLHVDSQEYAKKEKVKLCTYSFFHVPQYYKQDYVEEECKNRLVHAMWKKPSLRRYMPSPKAKSKVVTKTLKRLSK